VVTRFQRVTAGPHGLDDSGPFVAEDHRQGDVVVEALFHAEAAVANTGRRHADQNLSGLWLPHGDLFDLLRLARVPEYWRENFHGDSLS
jgi:hypothetical protein